METLGWLMESKPSAECNILPQALLGHFLILLYSIEKCELYKIIVNCEFLNPPVPEAQIG